MELIRSRPCWLSLNYFLKLERYPNQAFSVSQHIFNTLFITSNIFYLPPEFISCSQIDSLWSLLRSIKTACCFALVISFLLLVCPSCGVTLYHMMITPLWVIGRFCFLHLCFVLLIIFFGLESARIFYFWCLVPAVASALPSRCLRDNAFMCLRHYSPL